MIIASLADGLWRTTLPINLLWPGGLAAWLAALLLIKDTPTILRIQVGILIGAGMSFLVYSISQGATFHLLETLTSNTTMLSMIAAVGFLRLVSIPDTEIGQSLPVGKHAFFKTLIGVSFFSSFINISAPLLIADRIHRQSPIGRLTTQSIIRVFCSVSSWSPFFGAMAVVLTYAPGAELSWIAIAGFPFAMASIGLVSIEGFTRYREQLDSFVGYPMSLRSLIVPVLLVICVVIGSWLLYETSTLVIIILSALTVTTLILIQRKGFHSSKKDLGSFIVEGLPSIVNELILFLSAGVLAAGISGLVNIGLITNPFSEFGVIAALKLLGCMIILSAVGVHPVIQITSFTPLILPLNPDPNLLAVTYLFAWHLGTCSSPLSGTNLVFQGRYGTPSWKIAVWNWPYSMSMFLIAVFWLQYITQFFPQS